MIFENSKNVIGKSKLYDAPVSFEKKLTGTLNNTVNWIKEVQLLNPDRWAIFVNQFRLQKDSSNHGWRGEYWGKMMRGAAHIVAYTGDDALYSVLEESVKDMLTVAEPDGRVSSYQRDYELEWWDIWSRKYVILAMEYFLDICRDKALEKEIISFMCRQMDYIVAHVGDGEGQKSIIETAKVVESLNSCSILEPTVRLYRLTGDKKYLDFAKYIVDCGGSSSDNIFEKAYEDTVPPHEFNVVKAYEMISCFEGLVEYYYATGNERYRESALRFGRRLIENETTVIGGAACWGEYFDHASIRQTRRNEEETMQETCVTVTWMKFCHKLFLLGGESIFLDCIETSFYNAYLGALNTKDQFCHRVYNDTVKSTLPFDSYSPLTPDVRGRAVGGPQVLEDGRYYGCCAAIGAAGAGLFASAMLSATENGILLGLYESGSYKAETPSGKELVLNVKTDYPYIGGRIEIGVDTDDSSPFDIVLRVPVWSQKNALTVNGEGVKVNKGLNVLNRVWKKGDVIVLDLDMSIRHEKAPVFETSILHSMVDWDNLIMKVHTDTQKPEDRLYVCLKRGPIVLAATEELSTDIYEKIDPVIGGERIELDGFALAFKVKNESGKEFTLVDYGSAGKDWSKKITAWLPVSEEYLNRM